MSSSLPSLPAWKERLRQRPLLAAGGALTLVAALGWIVWGSWRWRDVLLYGVLVGGLLPGLVPGWRTAQQQKELPTAPAAEEGHEEAKEMPPSSSLPGAMQSETPSSHIEELPSQPPMPEPVAAAPLPSIPPSLTPTASLERAPSLSASARQHTMTSGPLSSSAPQLPAQSGAVSSPLGPSMAQPPLRSSTADSEPTEKQSKDKPRRSSGAFHRLNKGVRETKRLLRRVNGDDDETQQEEEVIEEPVVETLRPGAIPIDVYRNAIARAEEGDIHDVGY